jgi:hypothetical protein
MSKRGSFVTHDDFLRESARECRELADRTNSNWARRELLFWAREFEAMTAQHRRSGILQRPFEPVD